MSTDPRLKMAKTGTNNHSLRFFTGIADPAQIHPVRLLIASLRAFGGEISQAHFWVFATKGVQESCVELTGEGIEVQPLDIPESIRGYLFDEKVTACARAEELCGAGVSSLVWIDPQCLILQPPLLFDLGSDYDAAVRPVHIRNVGSSAGEPPDSYWQAIHQAAGVSAVEWTIESFIDRQRLRAYFNSHAFAVKPQKGLLRRWQALFTDRVNHAEFQQACCQDEPHRVFLFQALLSTLLATELEPARIRILPPAYNYPYHLHGRVPAERRPAALDDLVCLTYEERSIQPAEMTDIAMGAALREWLEKQVTSG